MYSNIHDNDARLGVLLQQLEEDGVADNTIVMHWSDHGPLPRGKRWLYDAGIRVPLIVRWPGRVAAGTRESRLVSTIDLAPTVLSLCGLPVPPYMQGKIFLGDRMDRARDYVFATRDRMDTHYDRVRAVRDERYKYIRNYYPYQSRFPWIEYLNRHPIMQELRRLYVEGKLTPEQSQLFEPVRPVEELYDTASDPHELRNIACDPEVADVKSRLSTRLDEWVRDVDVMGGIDESEMVRRWWPNGRQPVTGSPAFFGVSVDDHGEKPLCEKAVLKSPCALQLASSVQGASIGYQWETDSPESWRVYAQPLPLKPGRTSIRARAIRIGYKPSEVVSLELEVV
jgi:hypothetical protein